MRGGHTTVSDKVNSPVVSVMAIGHQERVQNKAVAGQDIVVTKHIGMSGIRTVIDCKRDEILKVYSEDIINKALGDETELLVAKEAEIFMRKVHTEQCMMFPRGEYLQHYGIWQSIQVWGLKLI